MNDNRENKLKILFVVERRNLEDKNWSLDYQCDLLFHGLVSRGHEVTDTNYIRYLSQPITDEMRPKIYGLGFSIGGKLPDRSSIDRDPKTIVRRIRERYYDLVVYGSIWRCADHLDLVRKHYPRDRVVLVDGEDHGHIKEEYVRYGFYFKRELNAPHAGVYPISFAIPREQFDFADPGIAKTRTTAALIPGKRETYVYTNEKDYYNAYAESRFALTKRKGGWDCLRHYEILAAHAIPVFSDFEACPSTTMTTWPRDLQLRANTLAAQWSTKPDDSAYAELNAAFSDYALKHLTTEALADYVVGKATAADSFTSNDSFTHDIGELILDAGGEDLSAIVVGNGSSSAVLHAFLTSGRIGRVYYIGCSDGETDDAAVTALYGQDPRLVRMRGALGENTLRPVPDYVDLAYISDQGSYFATVEAIRTVCNRCEVLAGDGYNRFAGVCDAVDGIYGEPDVKRGDGLWLVRDPRRRLCVVVPMYSPVLTAFEHDSLLRCISLFGRHHDIAVVCPDGFDTSGIPGDVLTWLRFERFGGRYFTGKEAYSRLCTTRAFYERFMAYTHILVYQLDGYAFRDDMLERWMRYDYVGAPWCYLCHTCSMSGKYDRVGNGGMSLRRVGVFHELLGGQYVRNHPEDVNLTTAAHNPTRVGILRRPSCVEALRFSIETLPERNDRETGSRLFPGFPYPDYAADDVRNVMPSLCHRLHSYDPELFAKFKAASERQ